MTDFSTYKFRCSSLPQLMVSSRSKDEILSETTKAYLRELWIKEVYGREKLDKANKYTTKGVMCEPDSMDLVNKVTGVTYFKNTKQLENEYITGTPDVIVRDKKKKPKSVIDIKTSWDIWTFSAVDEKKAYKDYYYQLFGYMLLTAAKSGTLMYCLVNTPDTIADREMIRLSYNIPELTTGDSKIEEEIRKNFVFDDIRPSQRVKQFMFDFNSMYLDELITKITAAREYMKGLTL